MLCVFACHTIVIYPEVVCIPAEVWVFLIGIMQISQGVLTQTFKIGQRYNHDVQYHNCHLDSMANMKKKQQL